MSFGLDYDNLPQISTFGEARRHYARVKPINGRVNDGIRPIGARNLPHYSIEKVGDNYVARCHRSDLVTFCPNGDILVTTDGWDSKLTSEFINCILMHYRPCVSRFDSRIWMLATYEGTHGWTMLGNRTTILRGEEGRLEVLNPVKIGVEKLDIKRLNAVKKNYAALYAYTDRYVAMMRGDRDQTFAYLPVSEGTETIRYPITRYENVDDPEKLYDALRSLQFGWTSSSPYRGGNVSRKSLNTLLKFHYHNAVHYTERLRYGKRKKGCFVLPE